MEKQGLAKTIIIAAVIFFFSAFFFESPPTSFVVFILMTVVSLLQKKLEMNVRITKALIYLAMFLLTMGVCQANDYLAKKRAEMIIAVTGAYMQKNGAYPRTLSDLVPEFIPAIPPAKYTLNTSGFTYIARDKQHVLIYTKRPPYGRAYYIFEDKKWGTSD